MIANHRETLEIRDRWGAMIVQRLGLGMLLGLACLVACQALPDSGTCGNGIAETNLHEDCDGTATLPGTVCNAQCHFSCAASNVNGGSPPKCPGGYFCGSDGTCRSPSGDFGALASQLQSAAYRVDLADVDGDGLKDLIATPPGLTRIQFFNGTSFGEFFDIPNASGAAPIVGRVSQTSIQDLLFPVGPIAVWQGRTDRTLEAISYPTLAFDGSSDGLRVVFADTHAVIDNAPASGEETYFFAPTPGAAATESSSISIDVAGTMVPLQSLRVSSENIAGEVQVGPLVTGGCPNALVYAFARNSVGAGGTPGVEVFDPCQALPGGVLPAPGASPAPPLPVVRFPAVPGRPNARYVVGNKGVLLVDFDGDGRLDVLIHTEIDTTLDDDRQPKIFLAYGTGDGHFQSTPPSDHATDDGLAAELDPALRSQLGPPNLDVFPLAAGQITKSSGDNLCDFVLSDRILLRSNTLQSGGATFSASIQSPPNTLWQTAKIGNFNGDDLPDIAAGSSGGFDFYAGTKLPLVMTPYNATVLNGAAHLATGDFDGDGTTDIAFSSGTEMSVAFGKAGGGPGAPVSMGRFSSEIQHVSAGPFPIPNRQSDGLADIAVLGKKSGDSTSQVLSVLLGSVSRQLISPFQLHVQAATNNDRVPALMSAVGAFQVHSDPAAAADVAAFASQRPGTTEDVSMWKIPISPEGQVMTDGVTASALSIPGYTRTVVNGETSSTVHTLRLGAAAMGAVDLDSTKNDALDALDE
ncbi:MAG TPA: VCBS repeat-containing protein, partial [Polyangiaceae bacterium]|nr:VCBS repeat-containing protein [Polyangiaceae bacterium]